MNDETYFEDMYTYHNDDGYTIGVLSALVAIMPVTLHLLHEGVRSLMP